jgi:hypothetical protein
MSVADVIAAGVVLAPIAYGSLIVLGKLGVGPFASEAGFSTDATNATARVPGIVSLNAGEAVKYQTDPKRDRWKYHAIMGVFLLPVGWGIGLLIYAYRVRKRSRYVVTDERIIEESPDGVVSYDYESISQVQSGARVLESLFSQGNVQFSIDNRQLVTLGWMQNPDELAGLIDKHTS